jgi:serine phosphatase RsbU (regulator of sigma subunit)/CheY-like chemotaxis protein
VGRAAEVLESKGYKVNTAGDVAQAVALVLSERPDLILMSTGLREMDERTLAIRLKSDPATRDIRLVAWTASTARHGAENAAAAGCDCYIIRSMDVSTLAAEVAPFLVETASPRQPDATQRRGLRILVVDDNALLRAMLAALLIGEGHVVLEAADGVEALSILKATEIDAVISDLMMPSMDGYQLCQKIRGDARYSSVPVIIYSGSLTSLASETLAAELGAVRFLRKPAPLDTIIATLRDVLGDAESRRNEASRTETLASRPSGNERRLIEHLKKQNRKFEEATGKLLQTHHELLVLSRALEQSEEALRRKNAQLEEDMGMARETHLALLPRTYPGLPSGTPPGESALRFHQHFAPKGTVSGDFFHVPTLSDTKAGVFICDVMGHDVRAALITAVIRGVLGEVVRAVSNPGEVLAEINRTLVPILRQTGTPMFASAFYMTADAASGEIQYANAGHPSPFLVRRDTGAIERLGVVAHGPALGLMRESRYPTGRRTLVPRDRVLLFTDGIFEVDGPDEEPFGQERLLDAVRSRIDLPQEQLFGELLDEVQRFSVTDAFEDDVCLLGMEVDHLC